MKNIVHFQILIGSLLLGGCTPGGLLTIYTYSGNAFKGSWQTPHLVDQGGGLSFPGSITPTWPNPLAGYSLFQNYMSFQVQAPKSVAPSSAVFAGSIFDGTFHTLARTYTPLTQGGVGWAPAGTGFSTYDSDVVSLLGVTDVSLAFSPSGSLLATGWGTDAVWSAGLAGPTETAPVVFSSASNSANGFTGSVAWDNGGNAYAAVNVCSNGSFLCQGGNSTLQVFKQIAGAWQLTPVSVSAPNPGPSFAAGLEAPQVQMVSDGISANLIYLDARNGNALTAARSSDILATPLPVPSILGQFTNPTAVSLYPGGLYPVETFAADGDGSGDLLVAFIQGDPNSPGCDTTITPPSLNCQFRIFGVFRGADGTWSAPTQLDSDFDQTSTELYQNSTGVHVDINGNQTTLSYVAGGIDYFTPGVAYVGGGRFLVVYSLINNLDQTSGIYYRAYTVGQGWDLSSTILETIPIGAADTQFRVANDLKLVSNGNGYAMLMSHYVMPAATLTDVTDRNYGYEIYLYNTIGGWSLPYLTSTSIACPAIASVGAPPVYYPCWDMKIDGAIFSNQEAIAVFPLPLSGTVELQLNAMEFHP